MSDYAANLRRLLHRWDPRGVLISDERALKAVSVLNEDRELDSPCDGGSLSRDLSSSAATQRQVTDAQWAYSLAVHPVLEQPIPSAFRVCSFMPVTALISLGMISTKSPLATVVYHWLYQSHSAATRYCNYADTTRPLDARRMVGAY